MGCREPGVPSYPPGRLDPRGRGGSDLTPELIAAIDAFMQEHRRSGELDGSVDGARVWMACDCESGIAHPSEPLEIVEAGEPEW